MSDEREQSVLEFIDACLEKIRDCPMNHHCRSRLQAIRDETFLELPEDRNRLLSRVGAVINDGVPSGETNSPIDDYWYEIREMFNRACGRT